MLYVVSMRCFGVNVMLLNHVKDYKEKYTVSLILVCGTGTVL